MAEVNEEIAAARADKKRRRRRFGVRALLPLLVLVPVGYALWNSVERSALDSLVARYHAQGIPIRPEDFAPESGADSPDNPAPELEAAAAALEPVASDAAYYGAEFPLTPRESAQLEQFVKSNAEPLSHVDSAFAKTGVADWKIPVQSPVLAYTNSKLNPQHDLALLLKFAAMDAHRRGDDDEAVRRVRQLLFVARANYGQPGLIGHMLVASHLFNACRAVREILPDLSIDHGATRPAASGQVRALIAELLDERAQRESRERTARFERMTGIDFARTIVARGVNGTFVGRGRSPLVGFLVAPFAHRDARLSAMYWDGIEEAWRAPTFPACRARLDLLPDPAQFDTRVHPVLKIILPAYERATSNEYQIIAETRSTALSLAIHLYRSEHDGRLPADLPSLVPRYIAQVPQDPMAASAPLGFNRATPCVYSVGHNGVDDGGSDEPLHPSHLLDAWERLDFVVYLTRQPRTPPAEAPDEPGTAPPDSQPATQPIESQRSPLP